MTKKMTLLPNNLKGSGSKRQNESAENMFTIASEYFAEEPKTSAPKRRERQKDNFYFLLFITKSTKYNVNYRLYFNYCLCSLEQLSTLYSFNYRLLYYVRLNSFCP